MTTNLQKGSCSNLKLVLHTAGFCDRRYFKLVGALASNIHTNYPLLGRDMILRFFFKLPNKNVSQVLRFFLPCCKVWYTTKRLPSYFITKGRVMPCTFTVSHLYIATDAVWELLLGHSHSPAVSFSTARAPPQQSLLKYGILQSLWAQWLWAPWASLGAMGLNTACPDLLQQ